MHGQPLPRQKVPERGFPEKAAQSLWAGVQGAELCPTKGTCLITRGGSVSSDNSLCRQESLGVNRADQVGDPGAAQSSSNIPPLGVPKRCVGWEVS